MIKEKVLNIFYSISIFGLILGFVPEPVVAISNCDLRAVVNEVEFYDNENCDPSSESSSGLDLSSIDVDSSENVELGRSLAKDLKAWDGDEFTCLYDLWSRESGWNHLIQNHGHRAEGRPIEDSAYGIPQSFPGSKMATHGDDWRTNPETQIKWGLDYIEGRYSTPCGALTKWLEREASGRWGWY